MPSNHYNGDLKADLLAAALDLIAESGPDAVTARAVAAKVNVSHAAPARWYPTMGHLLTAAATEAFAMLTDHIVHAQLEIAPDADPVVTVRASAWAYVHFAETHPSHFAVMWREDLLLDDPHLTAAGEKSLEQLSTTVSDLMNQGWATGRHLQTVGDLVWSTAHGLAMLRAAGPYQALPIAEFRDRVNAAIGTLAASLDTPPPASAALTGSGLKGRAGCS